MARTSTALTAVRFATELENSLGQYRASPNWFYPWCRAEEVNPENPPLQPRFLTADRFLRLPVRGEYTVGGRVSMEVGPENFGHFWYGMLSNLSTSLHTAGVTTQNIFTLATTQPTFEMQCDKGYVETWNTGGIIRAATFAVDRNSILTADLDFMFQQQAIITAGTFPTPTYSALDPFTDMKGTMERDDGTVTDMDGFTLNINCAPLDFKAFGSQYFTDFVMGKAEMSIDLACAFANDTEFRRFLGDKTDTDQQNISERYQTVKIEWKFQTGQLLTQSVSYNELLITIPGAIYSTFPHGIASDNELLRSRPVALVRYDTSATYDLEVRQLSAQATVHV